MDAVRGRTYIDDAAVVKYLGKSTPMHTSIVEKSLQNGSIFPNPVKDGLVIIILADADKAEVRVYDLMGRIALSGNSQKVVIH